MPGATPGRLAGVPVPKTQPGRARALPPDAVYPDGLRLSLHGTGAASGRRCSNPAPDAVADPMATDMNPAKRLALPGDVVRTVMADAALIPVIMLRTVTAMRSIPGDDGRIGNRVHPGDIRLVGTDRTAAAAIPPHALPRKPR
jgi:hypothetical protein